MDPPPTIVYFDGVCGLCNRLVDFILPRDRRKRILFSPLQSERGEAIRRRAGLSPAADLDTVVVEEGERIYVRSAGVLRVLRRLGPPWSLLYYAGIALPRPVRDALYRFVARRRYRWFGKRSECRAPTPAERARFVE